MRLLHRVASIPQRGGDASEDSAHYRELFENAGDLIYTTDLAGNFTSINPAGERLTGYTREELLASNIGQIVAAESLGTILQMMDHAVKGVSPTTYELEVLAKDGRQVPMEVSTRLIAQGGEVVGVHGIGRDISMRRRANRKFQQRTAHLEALNAIVAAADAAPDLPLLLTVVIDRVLEALTLGMGGIWAGDHHVVRGLSPEIGATVVAAVQSSQPKTAATASVADWQALSADGVHPQAEQWIGVHLSRARGTITEPPPASSSSRTRWRPGGAWTWRLAR